MEDRSSFVRFSCTPILTPRQARGRLFPHKQNGGRHHRGAQRLVVHHWWQPVQAPARVPAALNTPNRRRLSCFGPAVKKSVLVAPTIPFPKTSVHNPSTLIGLPFL